MEPDHSKPLDLATSYLGLQLRTPLIAGASPITHHVDIARELEQHGAGALIMRSLFEEQLTSTELAMYHHTTAFEYSHAEAQSYLPDPMDALLESDAYLAQLESLAEAVSIPVIGSLNGATTGGWTRYARSMESAGAAAIELNLYHLATDPDESGSRVEQRYIDVVQQVKQTVSIPVAVKLSPFFSAPVHMAKRLDAAGADGLVLFNRFYQPDIDIDSLDITPALHLSDSHTLLMRLRWLAATFGHVKCSLSATGGVHTGRDVIKALMAGANTVQLASTLLEHGAKQLGVIRAEMEEWMTERVYHSVQQMIGSMSLARCPDPARYERANYMKVLHSWAYRDLP
jgi:dihydroorotate dehydrogenase (fumarate)